MSTRQSGDHSNWPGLPEHRPTSSRVARTIPADTFSVHGLSIFERPGAEVKKREERYHAGCWVYFENGWTVSIQWGNGNYGSNYERDLNDTPQDATSAEIAVWNGEHGDLVPWRDGDTVQGYCSMQRVQRVLDLVAEDKLVHEFVPPPEPPPAPELRADDGWESEGA